VPQGSILGPLLSWYTLTTCLNVLITVIRFFMLMTHLFYYSAKSTTEHEAKI
jgi:hypothetical protein